MHRYLVASFVHAIIVAHMKICVLGSGVLGVSTAYFLAKDGHEVTVIDRHPKPAAECSYANGGQLSYCHAEPWSNPKSLHKGIRWMHRDDMPLKFRLLPSFQMWRWTLSFVRNCTKARTLKNTETMLRIGTYSREIMHQMQDELSLDFHYEKGGILNIFEDEHGLNCFKQISAFQQEKGDVPFELLSAEECIAKEPALAHRECSLTGGVYYPNDETGNVHMFTTSLAEKIQKAPYNVTFRYDTEVERLERRGGKIAHVELAGGEQLRADAYVLAMGAYSSVYSQQVGLYLPVYPMKGYSVSVQVEDESKAPKMSITDHKTKVVYSRLGNILRAAGTAEFAGYNHDISPVRMKMLKDMVKKNFGGCGDVDAGTEWACLRPSTPDGPPILGGCKVENLYLSTGNGTLGWTQGPGSAKITADIIAGRTPEIDLTGLTAERF